tara:strand:+ start:2886 stop:3677 length:792 start_codon:yes stop_codon:yes gene_type:complete
MGWAQLIGGAAGYFLGGGLSGAAAGAALGGGLDEATGGGTTGAIQQATNAANAQSAEALALQRRMYEEGVARQQPFYQAGVNALPGYLKGIAPGGEYVRNFTMADFNADPGYAFRLSEGQKALDRQAAARGGLMSGGALKAAARYGQDMGKQDYNRALQDFYGRQDVARNAAAGVVGYGPSGATSQNALATNFGNAASTNLTDQGNTSANAMLASERARQSAYGNIGKAFGSGGFDSLVSGFYGPGQYNQRMGVNFTDPYTYG